MSPTAKPSRVDEAAPTFGQQLDRFLQALRARRAELSAKESAELAGMNRAERPAWHRTRGKTKR